MGTQKQLFVLFDNILSKFQWTFQKKYDTQSCLLMMLELCLKMLEWSVTDRSAKRIPLPVS